MEEDTKEFIQEIRKGTNLSPSAFAQKYNIPLRTIEDWEAGRRRCPPYVTYLLKRCINEGLFVLPVTREPLKSLRKKAGITRKYLSDAYNIPLRTLESWEAEVRPQHCPPYVADMIERCVRCDRIPLYFCVLKVCTGNTAHENEPGKGWFFVHEKTRYPCVQENMSFKIGYLDKHQCERVKKITEKDLIDLGYGESSHEVKVLRSEEVPRYAPDFNL